MNDAATNAERLVQAAAANNANWCDVMCRSHGLTTTFDVDAWTSQRRSPLYPDAVTLSRTCLSTDSMSRIDDGSGCSVKDSFAELDLSDHGLRVLFNASWIALPHLVDVPTADTALDWHRVTTPAELNDWQRAWSPDDSAVDLFRPALLDERRVVLLAAFERDQLVAGAVLFVASDVVGLTNFFAPPHAGLDALRGCLHAAGVVARELPIVG